MAELWTKVEDAPLYAEHLLLGATYDDDEPLIAAPHHYGEGDDHSVVAKGCALADLSGMTALLVSGEGSTAFVEAACARRPLTVGSCAFTAVVTGDGAVAATPLLARTGDNEYLLCDPSERGLALLPWLQFLAAIEQDGYRPFGSVKVEDVSANLVPLALWGPEAPEVLSDYLSRDGLLPRPGHVHTVELDRVQCVALCPVMGEQPCYLLFVPPTFVRLFWRSLLSFLQVTPLGTDGLSRAVSQHLPWYAPVIGSEELSMDFAELIALRIARGEGGFVGARALADA